MKPFAADCWQTRQQPTTNEEKGNTVKKFLIAAAVVAIVAVVGPEAMAQAAAVPVTANAAPAVEEMATNARGLAYGMLVVAVAVVGVKLGIRFVKWIRG